MEETDEKKEENASVIALATAIQCVVDFLNNDVGPLGEKFDELFKKIDEQDALINVNNEEIKLQLEEIKCFLEDMKENIGSFWQQGRMNIESGLSVLEKSD